MRFVAFALVLLAGSAGAQTMYRCGNTYSQQPCGPDAAEVKVQGVRQPVVDTIPAEPAKTAAMQAACREWIARVPAWKDRESLRVGNIVRGRLVDHEIDGKPTRVRVYFTYVNAKNSYGAYQGERMALCLADAGETRILDGEIKP